MLIHMLLIDVNSVDNRDAKIAKIRLYSEKDKKKDKILPSKNDEKKDFISPAWNCIMIPVDE